MLALQTLALVAANATAQEPSPHFALLPERPYILAHVSDVRQIVRAGAKNKWFQLFTDEGLVDTFFDIAGDEMPLDLSHALETLGATSFTEAVESIGRLTGFVHETEDGEDLVGFIFDVADGSAHGTALLEVMCELLAPGQKPARATLDGTELAVFDRDDDSTEEIVAFEHGGSFALFGSSIDGLALTSASASLLRAKQRRGKGVPDALLAARGGDAPAHAELLVDVDAFSEKLAAGFAVNEAGEVFADALLAVPRMYLTARIGEGESLDFHLDMPVGDGTLFGDILGLARPVSKDMFRYMPAGCTSVTATTIDVAEATDLVFDYLRRYSPDVHAQAISSLGDLTESIGINLLDDVLDLFDGRFGSFTSGAVSVEEQLALEEITGGFPLSYIFGVSDGELLADNFDTLLSVAGMSAMLEVEDLGGYDLYDFEPISGVPIALVFGNDVVALSLSRDDLKHIASVESGRGIPSVLGDPILKRALQRHGEVRGSLSVGSTRGILDVALAAAEIELLDNPDEKLRRLVGAFEKAIEAAQFDGSQETVVEADSSHLSITVLAR